MLGSRLPRQITIESTDIVLPVDMQATLAVIIAQSDTPLAANASYETSWIDVGTKSGIRYLVDTDADGTLKIQHSKNGDVVNYEDSVAITGGTPASNIVIVRGNYAKVVYENGANAQTKFALLVVAVP